MLDNWLVQNFISDLLFLGVTAVGAAVIAYLSVRRSRWMVAVLAATLFVTCAVVIKTSLVLVRYSTSHPQTEVGDLQNQIEKWARKYRLGLRRDDNEETLFRYRVTRVAMGQPEELIVERPKGDFSDFLDVRSEGPLRGNLLKNYETLNEQDRNLLADEISVELARANMEYSVNLPKRIMIQKALPITADLSEFNFLQAMQDVFAAQRLASVVLQRRIGVVDATKKPSRQKSSGR